MSLFCFVCPECGYRVETTVRDPGPTCGRHSLHFTSLSDAVPMRRDYRAEGIGVGSGVRVSRDGTDHERAALFLPGNDEFKGPDDPDGTKGMREWHDTHQPKETSGNRALVPGNIERKSF